MHARRDRRRRRGPSRSPRRCRSAAAATCPIEALGTFFGPKGKEVTRDLEGGSHLPGLHVRHAPGRRGGGPGHRAGASAPLHRRARRRPRDQPSSACEGQIIGAAVQGLGQALLEEVVVQDGVNLTGGLFQYLIPTATDVPDIEAVILESGEGHGPVRGPRDRRASDRPPARRDPRGDRRRRRRASDDAADHARARARVRGTRERSSEGVRNMTYGVEEYERRTPKWQGGVGARAKLIPGGVGSAIQFKPPYPLYHRGQQGLAGLGSRRQRVHRLLALLRGDGGGPREPDHRGGDQAAGRARHALRHCRPRSPATWPRRSSAATRA